MINTTSIKCIIAPMIMSRIYGRNKRFNGLTKSLLLPRGTIHTIHLSTDGVYYAWHKQEPIE